VRFFIIEKTGKVKFFLFLTKHHIMKLHRGSGCITTRILTSAQYAWEWPAPRSCRFIPGWAPGNNWIGGRLGFRSGLESVAKRRIPFLTHSRNGKPLVQTLAYLLYWLRHCVFRMFILDLG